MNEYIPLDRIEELEGEWKEDNWCFSSVTGEYVEETINVFLWNSAKGAYEAETDDIVNETDYTYYEGELYDEVNEDGIPFHLVDQLTINF